MAVQVCGSSGLWQRCSAVRAPWQGRVVAEVLHGEGSDAGTAEAAGVRDGRTGGLGALAVLAALRGAAGGSGMGIHGGLPASPPSPYLPLSSPAGGTEWDGMRRGGNVWVAVESPATEDGVWCTPLPPESEPGWGAQLPPAGGGGRGGAAPRCLPPDGPRCLSWASSRLAPARPAATVLEGVVQRGRKRTPPKAQRAVVGAAGHGRVGTQSTCRPPGPS